MTLQLSGFYSVVKEDKDRGLVVVLKQAGPKVTILLKSQATDLL